MNCAQCGKVLAPGAKFCTGCGTPVAAGPAAPQGMPQQPAPGQPQSYQDQRKLEQQAVLKEALRSVNPQKDKAALFRARTDEERDRDVAEEAIREIAALRNTRVATLVAAVLCGLFWGWFTKLTMSEFGYIASGIGGFIGGLATFTCRGKADQNILFIAGFSAVLGILIGKATTYVLLQEQIASGEFMLLTFYDVLWLALAVTAAVEMPHRLAPLFSTHTDMRIQGADVPDSVQRDQEQSVSLKQRKTMYVLGGALVVFGVIMGVLLIIKTFNYGVGEKYKSTPRAGACKFHKTASITLPEKNWFEAESGYQNNQKRVVAVYHRGKKKYDIRLKIFEMNKEHMLNFQFFLENQGKDPNDWSKANVLYTKYVIQTEFTDIKLEHRGDYENENGEVIGALMNGESGKGGKKLEHIIFTGNPYNDNGADITHFYYLWFTIRGEAGDDAYAEIDSIINSFGVYE